MSKKKGRAAVLIFLLGEFGEVVSAPVSSEVRDKRREFWLFKIVTIYRTRILESTIPCYSETLWIMCSITVRNFAESRRLRCMSRLVHDCTLYMFHYGCLSANGNNLLNNMHASEKTNIPCSCACSKIRFPQTFKIMNVQSHVVRQGSSRSSASLIGNV